MSRFYLDRWATDGSVQRYRRLPNGELEVRECSSRSIGMQMELLSIPPEAGEVDAIENAFQPLESRAGRVIDKVARGDLHGMGEDGRRACMGLVLSFQVRSPKFVDKAIVEGRRIFEELRSRASPALSRVLEAGAGPAGNARALSLLSLPVAAQANETKAQFNGTWVVIRPERDAPIPGLMTSDDPVVRWEPEAPDYGPQLTMSVGPDSLFVVLDPRTHVDKPGLEHEILLRHTAHCIQRSARCAITDTVLLEGDVRRALIAEYLPALDS